MTKTLPHWSSFVYPLRLAMPLSYSILVFFRSRHSWTCYTTQATEIFLLWLGSLKSFGLWWLDIKTCKKHLTNNHLSHCRDVSLFFWLYSDINLKEQYRLVELKKMLSQYGMRSFHVSYASLAKVCCERYHVWHQRVLFKENTTELDWGLLAKLLNWATPLHCKGRLRWKTSHSVIFA